MRRCPWKAARGHQGDILREALPHEPPLSRDVRPGETFAFAPRGKVQTPPERVKGRWVAGLALEHLVALGEAALRLGTIVLEKKEVG
jgi:hypothetical protein